MTTVQTFNRIDTQETREAVERVRLDRRTNPGAAPSAYVNAEGATVATPGELAPFGRVPPFPTPEQDYGAQDQVIGYVTPLVDPQDTPSNTGPVINVEDWRQITFTLRYATGAANGQLAVTPLYGVDSEAFPLPRMVPASTVTPAGEYGDRIMYKERFLTPVMALNSVFEVRMVFDVSAFKVFALSLLELNEDITCTGDEPTCSRISLSYSLSM